MPRWVYLIAGKHHKSAWAWLPFNKGFQYVACPWLSIGIVDSTYEFWLSTIMLRALKQLAEQSNEELAS
jgi:hypothetical protein